MRTRTILSCLVAASLIGVVGPVVQTRADTLECAKLGVGLHQLLNLDTTANLLTPFSAEVASAKKYGYEDFGVVVTVAQKAASDLTAVHRMQRGGDFLWAQSQAQLAQAKAAGYADSGSMFYAPTDQADPCLTAVYQLQVNGVHRIAVGDEARDALLAGGWSSPQTVFYGVSTGVIPDAETPRPVILGPTAKPDAGSDSDPEFTIAIMPDTQNETNRSTDKRFPNRTTWLIANQKKLDLRFVLHSGDVVNWDTSDHGMYANAVNALLPLQAKIPMALAIGNHDTAAVCAGGSACPGRSASVGVRNTTTFNTYFPKSRFGAMTGQFEAGKVDNAYHEFRAGGRNWLVLNLELWPRKPVLDWAAKVAKSHPHHNVIIVTHSFLTGKGKISGSSGGYGATSPRQMFDKVIKPNGNVKFVFSGHVGQSALRVDRSAKKTKIVSMMETFHSKSNPVRLVRINTSKKTIKTWIYVPDQKKTITKYTKKVAGLKFVR